MMSAVFDKAYKSLNKEQKEAVDAIDGPVMVIAGPGTGKTQILTLRIANILRLTDTEPENILALTFTESAVYTMRKRLFEIIGPGAYKVNIFTFHGLCNTIIQNYIEYFPKAVGFVPALEADQVDIIESILKKKSFEKLKKLPEGLSRRDTVLHDIKSAISTLKRENVGVAEFTKTLEKRKKEFYKTPDLWSDKRKEVKAKYASEESMLIKNIELAEVYKLYEAELDKRGLYDYDDMVVSVVKNLSANSKLLSILQEQYQYILVDEHQDTNSAQNKVVELIASFYSEPNLFIVGDEKQAIFRFQGADLNNFLYFKRLYPNVRVISLEKNYRSHQKILDSAHSLILKGLGDAQGLRVELKSAKGGEGGGICLYEFSSEGAEYEFISGSIKEKIKSGVDPSEIAVLTRKNGDIPPIAKFLSIAGVPFMIDSEEDILEDSDIKKLIKIFRAVDDFNDDCAIAEAMYVDLWGVPPVDIYEVWSSARSRRASIIKTIGSPRARNELAIDEESRERIRNFFERIMTWNKLAHNIGLAELFEKIVNESGILKALLDSSEAIEKIEKVNALFDELKNLVERNRKADLKAFVNYIELLEGKHISVKRKIGGDMDIKRVRLMTAHRSKGREFDYVYITNAFDGHWGNIRGSRGIKLMLGDPSRSPTSEALRDEDERRLFYVALTRARLEIKISYAKLSQDGKNRLPTVFVADINPALIEAGDSSKWEKLFAEHKHKLLMGKDMAKAPLKDKEYLNAKFLEYGLSVSALNNYLRCPWEYFYNNLVRIPTAETVYTLYGQAIHYALENFFNKLKLGERASKDDLISLFMRSLESKPLSEKDFVEQKKRGQKSLSGYFDAYNKEWKKYSYLNEFIIRGVKIDEQTTINGKIDKVDILNDSKEVRVTDFKTSQPKSRNEIEGKSGDKSGDMKRQLVFYKLLLNRYHDGEYKMVEGVIDFVEPNARGKYKRESFIVTDEEVAELEAEIKKVSQEILDLAFWSERCENKKCEFCALRGKM